MFEFGYVFIILCILKNVFVDTIHCFDAKMNRWEELSERIED